jgi:MFS family permease
MNPRLFRLCAAAFLADMALYLTMTGVPYRALALGAGPLILGLLPAARALPYSLSTVGAGALTEGRERLKWARLSLIVAMVSVAALIPAPGLVWLFVLLAVLGTALAFFWPAIQASLADLAGHGTVTGNLGWFNIAWSSGKSVGFLVGGAILAGVGFGALFAAAALAMLAVVLLLRGVRIGGGADEHKAGASIHAPRLLPRNAGRFRLAAWIANAIAFGVVSVLNLQYPDWLERMGRPETLFGAFWASSLPLNWRLPSPVIQACLIRCPLLVARLVIMILWPSSFRPAAIPTARSGARNGMLRQPSTPKRRA